MNYSWESIILLISCLEKRALTDSSIKIGRTISSIEYGNTMLRTRRNGSLRLCSGTGAIYFTSAAGRVTRDIPLWPEI